MSTEIERLLVRVEATQRKFERQLKSMNGAADKSANKMERDFARSNKRSGASFKKLGGTAQGVLSGRFLRGAGLVGAITLVGAAALEAAKRGEKLLIVEKRLAAITGSAARAEASLDAILQVAQLTGTGIDTVADAFSRFTLASLEIGATTSEVETLTQTILQLGVIGGGAQAELSAGAQQLGQSLAKGVLNGDELRSVMENMPLVARAIADGLGVSVGKLKEMGAAGELTATKVFPALLAAADETNRKFEGLPLTIERASTRMTNAFSIFLAKVNDTIGASRILAGVFDGIASDFSSNTATGFDRVILDQEKKVRDSVSRLQRLRSEQENPGGKVSTLFSSKKRLEEARKQAEIEHKTEFRAEQNKLLMLIESVKVTKKAREEEKRDRLAAEKANAVIRGREKADRAEIVALQTSSDERAFNALTKRQQAIKKARESAETAFKLENPFATPGQVFNVGDAAAETAIEKFDAAKSKKKGGKSPAKELADFFANAEARKQSIRDETALIGLSESALIRLEAKQRLLAEAKKKGLDLDKRSIETGRTLREEIEASADELAELATGYENAQISQDRFMAGVDGVSDALAGALVAGESLKDGLRSVFQGIARDIISSGIRSAILGQFGSAKGGGGGGFLGQVFGLFSGGSLLSFDGGGFTGSGSRSGGFDGRGGFPALLHPNETVIDNTRSQGGATARVDVVVFVRDDGTLGAIASQAGASAALPVAVQVVNENNKQIPAMVSEAQRRS